VDVDGDSALTAASVVEVGHSFRDDAVDVGGADRRVVAGVTSVVRQVVDRFPRTLHRVDDSLLQIRTDATQALSQLCRHATFTPAQFTPSHGTDIIEPAAALHSAIQWWTID